MFQSICWAPVCAATRLSALTILVGLSQPSFVQAGSLRGATRTNFVPVLESEDLSEPDLSKLDTVEENAEFPGSDGLEDSTGPPIEMSAEDIVMTTDHLVRIGKLADSNNDTLLSAEELLHFAEGLRSKKRWELTDAAFASLDVDDDGSVARMELGQKALEGSGTLDAARFKVADSNADGILDREEFHTFAHPDVHGDVLRVEVEHQFKHFDQDGSGLVSYDEYKREDEVDEGFDPVASREDFDLHDTDHSGFLDASEFQELVGGRLLLTDSIKKAIAAADHDADGHIHIHDEVPKSIADLMASEYIEDFFFHEYAGAGGHQEL